MACHRFQRTWFFSGVLFLACAAGCGGTSNYHPPAPDGGPANPVDLAGMNTATCTDRIQNGMETDVDCGGPVCPQCGDSQGCLTFNDCTNGVCDHGFCAGIRHPPDMAGFDGGKGDGGPKIDGGFSQDLAFRGDSGGVFDLASQDAFLGGRDGGNCCFGDGGNVIFDGGGNGGEGGFNGGG